MTRRLAIATTTSLLVLGAAPLSLAAHGGNGGNEGGQNATTCADANLAGELLISGGSSDSIDGLSGQVESDGLSLNVEVDVSTWTITGTVVKGGPGYEVYEGDPAPDMQSPPNRGGNIPQVSHWFVCGEKAGPGEEPTKEPTQEPTKEPTMEPTKEPTKEPTSEPSPSPSEEPTTKPSEPGAGNGQDETPGPQPTDGAAPVPTAVPAGFMGEDSGQSAGFAALGLGAVAGLAGLAALARRRLGSES